MAQGPLSGVKIVEFAGIGPGPFCGMLLSDMGADVIRIDRPGDGRPGRAADVTGRGRRSIGLNLKDPADIETALKLLNMTSCVMFGVTRSSFSMLFMNASKAFMVFSWLCFVSRSDFVAI